MAREGVVKIVVLFACHIYIHVYDICTAHISVIVPQGPEEGVAPTDAWEFKPIMCLGCDLTLNSKS